MKRLISLFFAFIIVVQFAAVPVLAAVSGKETVYVTRTGKCYHTATCQYLQYSKIATTLEKADKKYRPCSVCRPPVLEETYKAAKKNDTTDCKYIVNTNTFKFHKPGCSAVKNMSLYNKKAYNGTRSYLINQGYSPCKLCHP